MSSEATTAATVDAYIAAAPSPAQPMLVEIRRMILDTVPSLVESVKYGMPAYAHSGRPFVHVSAAKAHVAIYGLVHVDGDVPPTLAPFLDHRSTLHFPFGEELPTAALVAALTRKAAAMRDSGSEAPR